MLVARGLAEALHGDTGKTDGAVHAWGRVHLFLPLPLVERALGPRLRGRPMPVAIARELDLHASDARLYAASYALYPAIADVWGWVAYPFRVGAIPAVLLGVGRHARVRLMNTAESVRGALMLAAQDKAFGRDLLAAHGLPVAPGTVVASVADAVRAASELGYPVVVKRLRGGNSEGVAVGLRDAAAVRAAARRWLHKDDRLLVESNVTGDELRLHFVSGRLHRVFMARPLTVLGDGRRTLAQLLARDHPRYFTTMSASGVQRDRLVTALWAQGVRTFDDVARIVPASRERVRVSAATGAGMTRVERLAWLRPADIAQLEALLARYGAPSGGIDLILRRPRAPLASHGAILEVNVPSGFAYLDDAVQVAAAELADSVAHDSAFRRSGGRIPVWMVLSDGASAARTWRAALRAFRRRHAGGTVLTVHTPDLSWPALLNRPSASALLLRLPADAVLQHGIPAQLRPTLLVTGPRAETRGAYPEVVATVDHAGGRVVRLSLTSG